MGKLRLKNKVGILGEDIACRFLSSNGHEIIERNYRKNWGEIDVVSQKDNIIHFVEVKSVTHESTSSDISDKYRPEDNIHPWKLKRLSRVTESFMLERFSQETDWQFDIAVVYINNTSREARVRFMEDIIL